MSPQRIQRKRTKGWRMPEGARSVTRPSRWGNPFTVSDAIEADYDNPQRACVSHFTAWMEQHEAYPDMLACGARVYDRRWMLGHLGDLRGLDLACYCPLDQPCHADVLLKLANAAEGVGRG